MNKKKLAIILSKLKTLEKPKIGLEQYQTECEIAAEVLWFAFMNNDIKDKIVADLGCGNGVLGVGSLILDAKKVFFVDKDKEAIALARENTKSLKLKGATLVNKEVENFDKKVDLVLQNPPFGVQKKHADRIFLEKAMSISSLIYSFHKLESKEFIKKLVEKTGFKVRAILKFKFPLRKTLPFHKKKVHYVDVGCWRIKRKV